MEHQHSHRYRKSKNMAGKLITILQLILSAALLILVWNSGMVPNLYLALMGAGQQELAASLNQVIREYLDNQASAKNIRIIVPVSQYFDTGA